MALQYTDLASRQISALEIGEEIIQQSGQQFLLAGSAQEIAAAALESLGFPKKYALADIAADCRLVIAHRHHHAGLNDVEVIELFNKIVFDIYKLPKPGYDRLINSANKDLQEISQLVAYYETLPFIVEFLAGTRSNGRNHAEYTQKIFI
ncbi:hypothetical protein OQZ33_17110 [Pedobacter sp. MC2016-05]|uniref:hypothetical protein n=1 Tax=Pedobacter sp. MC2016-05 TaxID=2994474 RepID=UPI0022468C94|nr:hypothetical protein [Pedobacter sp. MC2016-05]MCX2476056.1 hypothetical protein [Pedobacter sp. MC2016-05]